MKLRIVNAMFGRKKGAIEQAFIDYSKCLADLGCEVTVLAYQDTPLIKTLPEAIAVKTITNFGQWDPLAAWKLKKVIKDINPDIIIAHGSRATILLSKSVTDIPIVTVCHNYNIKQISACDNIITVTDELRRTFIKKGCKDSSITTIPNMVYIPPSMPEQKFTWQDPVVIGTMGRFVAKKGFNIFLRALKTLKDKNIPFKAILGGTGTDLEKLKSLATSLGIEDSVSFPGWIENKEEFFSSIDIFCSSSLYEPFGTVILEAFIYCVPVITTDTEGAIEVVRPHIDALMVEAGEADALADAMEKLITNPQFAEKIAREGYSVVHSTFDSKLVGKRLYFALEKIINQNKPLRVKIDDNELIGHEIKDMSEI
jgi:glycosyltransferase involved in cell wall biosynthesis